MKVSDLLSMYEPQGSPFATHVPLLRAVGKGIKTVLELGAGEFSTRLFLDRTYYPDLIELVTVEQDRRWVVCEDDYRHKIAIVKEPIEPFLGMIDFAALDLIFVDNSTSGDRRCDTLRYVAGRVTRSLVVAHDFDVPSYAGAAGEFENVIVDDRQSPHTALLWRAK